MSNYKLLTNFHEIDFASWDKFILSHPNGNVFQSPAYYQVISKTKNWIPFGYFVFDIQEIVACILGTIIKENKGIIGYFTSRAVVIGGPIIKNNDVEILDFILSKLVHDIHKRSIYFQFRNTYDCKSYQYCFAKYKFKFEEHLNIEIDLTELPENIMKKFHKSRRRNFKKSQNKGVSFEEIKSRQGIIDAYMLIRRNYSRIALPIPDISHFHALNSDTENRIARFFAAFHEESLIGVRVELVYNEILHDYYAGSDLKQSNKYPNDFLITSILKWGNVNGIRLFDFGGAGRPDRAYSVRDYKLQFSDNLTQFGRNTRINHRLLYFVGKAGILFWKKIKRNISTKG